MPTLIQGLDICYQRTGDGPIEFPELLPSDYFHRQIWISFVDDLIDVKIVGNVLDPDKVMFGSDDPHPASTWPDSQKVFADAARNFSPVIREKIFRDNAREFFAID